MLCNVKSPRVKWLPPVLPVGVQRSPLASIMLKVKLLDMGDPRSVLSMALSPPNISEIERTVLQLKEVRGQSPRRADLLGLHGVFEGRVFSVTVRGHRHKACNIADGKAALQRGRT